jgi:hypothetical protein
MMQTHLGRKRCTSISETFVKCKRHKPDSKTHNIQTRSRFQNSKVTLLSLPYDVRWIIYEHTLKPAMDLTTNLRNGTSTSSQLQFLLTCRTIYDEARMLAFQRAAFIIDFRARTERTTILNMRFVHDLRAGSRTKINLRQLQADSGPSPLERLCDAVLSMRPEHRGAVCSVALLLAASQRSWPIQTSDGPWRVDQSRTLHAVATLLPALRRITIPVCLHYYDWREWDARGIQLHFPPFQLFKYCYGAVLASPPLEDPQSGGTQMIRTVQCRPERLRPPMRLPPMWTSFRDTLVGRSVRSVVAPLTKYQGDQKANDQHVTHKSFAALVKDGRDPRDYCWLRIIPDIESDACRAGRGPQTWLAEYGDGRPISMYFSLSSGRHALRYFVKGEVTVQQRPWRFVEQGSGRSVEICVGWVNRKNARILRRDTCRFPPWIRYGKFIFSSTCLLNRNSSLRHPPEVKCNLAQFKEARAWKRECA